MTSLPHLPHLRRSAAVAIVVALALPVGLGACGSDGSEPTSSGKATTTAADGTTTADDGLPAKVEMADAQVLIGLTLDDAKAKADDAGWILRVLRVDGKDRPATNDYNPLRVNVSVADGKVDAIMSIG